MNKSFFPDVNNQSFFHDVINKSFFMNEEKMGSTLTRSKDYNDT